MTEDRLVANGREQLKEPEGYRAERAEIRASVRSRYAESLASAGVFRRLQLRLRMQREIAQEVNKLYSPQELIFQGSCITLAAAFHLYFAFAEFSDGKAWSAAFYLGLVLLVSPLALKNFIESWRRSRVKPAAKSA